jgi:hypothetical protein
MQVIDVQPVMISVVKSLKGWHECCFCRQNVPGCALKIKQRARREETSQLVKVSIGMSDCEE